jgi:hypothetical protein
MHAVENVGVRSPPGVMAVRVKPKCRLWSMPVYLQQCDLYRPVPIVISETGLLLGSRV